jgi:uncharacterized protein
VNQSPPAPAAPPPWRVCERCGRCCRWPGLVLLDADSIARISAFLGIDEREFLERFADVRPSRAGLMLKSLPDHSCIFLDGAGCRIHPVKPPRCREFPNGWNFPGWREQCRAVEAGG